MDLITIYENMRSKYGWDDGDSEPIGSYEARDAIVELINVNLPSDCCVEAYGYDRAGVHNGALILYRKKDSPQEIDEDEPDCIYSILYSAMDQEILNMDLTLNITTIANNLVINDENSDTNANEKQNENKCIKNAARFL